MIVMIIFSCLATSFVVQGKPTNFSIPLYNLHPWMVPFRIMADVNINDPQLSTENQTVSRYFPD